MYFVKSVLRRVRLAWFLCRGGLERDRISVIAVPFEMKLKQFAQWLVSLAERLKDKRSAQFGASGLFTKSPLADVSR